MQPQGVTHPHLVTAQEHTPLSTRHVYMCCNTGHTVPRKGSQAPPKVSHTPQTHTVQTACTHAHTHTQASTRPQQPLPRLTVQDGGIVWQTGGAPASSLEKVGVGCLGGTKPGQERRPQTRPHTVSPSSWHLWAGVCLSRSRSLPLSSSLCTDVPGAAASAPNGVRKGGWRGSVPREVGAAVPRTPPTKQRWGKGEGGRRNRRWTQSQGSAPPPPPSPPRPREMEPAQGWGGLRDTHRGRETEMERRGEGGVGEKWGAAQSGETDWNRDRRDAEKKGGQRESHKDRQGARHRERLTETRAGAGDPS